MLVLASVLGREFALEALARMGGVSEDELLDTLDEAMAARVVSDVPGAPGSSPLRARPHPRHALRGAHDRPPRPAAPAGGRGARGALRRRARAASRRARAPLRSPAATSTRALRYARRAGDRALGAPRLRGGRAAVRAALEALDLSSTGGRAGPAASFCSRSARRRSRAGNSAAAKEAFLGRRGHRAAPRPAARARPRGRRLRRADRLGAGRERRSARAAARGGARRARRRGRRAPGRGCSPAWRERFATSTRETAATAEPRGGRARPPHGRTRGARVRARRPCRCDQSRPDTVDECLALGSELREVAERIGDSERVVQALHPPVHRAASCSGSIAEAQARSRRGEPHRRRAAAARSALAGRLGAARCSRWRWAGSPRPRSSIPERASSSASARSRRSAIPVYRLQRYTLCDFRGSLEESSRRSASWSPSIPPRPVFRCALAHLHARLGRLAEARRVLRRARGATTSRRCPSIRSGSSA